MRLCPEEFWSYSLREFLIAIEGYAASKGAGKKTSRTMMSPAELEAYAQRYPDTPGDAAAFRAARNAEKAARGM